MNHVWCIGFDEDAENFYCRSIDNTSICPTVQLADAFPEPFQRQIMAQAINEANRRGLRVAAVSSYGNETLLFLVG